jgi:hypothetical protein
VDTFITSREATQSRRGLRGTRTLEGGPRGHGRQGVAPLVTETGWDIRATMKAHSRYLRRSALECAPTTQALHQYETQGVHVSARPQYCSFNLLGRKIRGRPVRETGNGHTRGIGQAGNTEISEVHATTSIDQNVRGLHVTVDDAGVVDVRERRGDTDSDLSRLLTRERSRPKALRQILSVDQIHHEIGPSVEITRIKDAHQIGVHEASQHIDFARETSDVAALGPTKYLNRNVPVETQVVRAIHDTHAASADDRLKAVATIEGLRAKWIIAGWLLHHGRIWRKSHTRF